MQMKFSDGQSEFSRVFNFAILGYSRNSRKLDASENLVFYSTQTVWKTWKTQGILFCQICKHPVKLNDT